VVVRERLKMKLLKLHFSSFFVQEVSYATCPTPIGPKIHTSPI